MNNLFEMPAAIKQAKESQGGMFFLWEILVFIGVFLVSIIIESIFLFPMEFLIQLGHPELTAAAASGDMNKYTSLLNEMMSGDFFTIISLFSTGGIILVTLLFCKLIQKRRMNSLGFVKKRYGKRISCRSWIWVFIIQRGGFDLHSYREHEI